jgi:hypothetical protein
MRGRSAQKSAPGSRGSFETFTKPCTSSAVPGVDGRVADVGHLDRGEQQTTASSRTPAPPAVIGDEHRAAGRVGVVDREVRRVLSGVVAGDERHRERPAGNAGHRRLAVVHVRQRLEIAADLAPPLSRRRSRRRRWSRRSIVMSTVPPVAVRIV